MSDPMAGTFKQIAVVVTDLQTAVHAYARALDIGPWNAFTLAAPTLKDMTYHGRAAAFSLRHALAFAGDVQFELVQPLSGPSIFTDHLDVHGPGLQHVGKYVDDHRAAVTEAERRGWQPLASARGFGARGDGAFAYFRPSPDIPMIVELIEAPAERVTPDFVYP